MKTYFIIVCYNNQTLIDGCIASIRNQTSKKYDIIFVDNGSSDKSVSHVKNKYPDITLIDNKKNLGFAIGNNIGIKSAMEHDDCRYVALLNTDATLDKNWLKTLVEFADQHPDGASFQTPTLDYYDHSILDSRGLTIDHKGRAVQLGYRSSYVPRKSHQVFGVNAAAALYSADFLKVQPYGEDYFDSDMWMYLEDVDIAARANIMGWKNWYVDGSFSYHMGSASSSKNPGFSVFMCYRNNSALIIKNLPFIFILKIIPGAIFTDFQTIIELLKHKNYRTIVSILKGRLWGVFRITTFVKKRRNLVSQNTTKIAKNSLWKLMQADE